MQDAGYAPVRGRAYPSGRMVPAFAFAAVAMATVFAQTMLVRYTADRRPHHFAWTVALTLVTLAAVALVVGVTTEWDRPTFKVFFLLGAVLSVPWLALGTVALLLGDGAGRRAQGVVLAFSGLATGIVASEPMRAVSGTAIPVGKDVFDAAPRVLAAVGSGVGATVIFVGALVSAVRAWRGGRDGVVQGVAPRRLAVANACIALGTLVLSSGGLVQGLLGHDEAFTLTLALGIAVIYVGFRLADRSPTTSPNLHAP